MADLRSPREKMACECASGMFMFPIPILDAKTPARQAKASPLRRTQAVWLSFCFSQIFSLREGR